MQYILVDYETEFYVIQANFIVIEAFCVIDITIYC